MERQPDYATSLGTQEEEGGRWDGRMRMDQEQLTGSSGQACSTPSPAHTTFALGLISKERVGAPATMVKLLMDREEPRRSDNCPDAGARLVEYTQMYSVLPGFV